MTAIVGIAYNGHVVMGGDSAGVAGYDIAIRRDEKVFEVEDFLMGFTSSFRMGQLLRYKFHPPKHHADIDLYQYMVVDFVDAVRKIFTDSGYMTVNNSVEQGGHFLVGYRGRLFSIQSDFQVAESSDGYDAVGCGESFALGSLYATRDQEKEPVTRVKLALEAAEYHSAGVAKPFKIIEK